MARPPEDPRITDLRRYKKARDAQARRAAKRPTPPAGREPLLGSRPRAGLILLGLVAIFLALTLLPRLL